ncbi:hypothetical protein FOL46_004409 [Perkinsus olseni]|uniref:Uncharacterized protein n=1 Tax=Perkinsus olseni TaxID=32597 RepID=A0A7J6MSR6_PEROL|nr:hypothetical protein FOL46_004409 [Perkinsus olseni]
MFLSRNVRLDTPVRVNERLIVPMFERAALFRSILRQDETVEVLKSISAHAPLPDHHLSEEIHAEGTRINGLYDEARQLEDAAAKRTRLFTEKLSRLEEELRQTILEATENSNMYEARIRTLEEEVSRLKALLMASERQSSELAGENAQLKEEVAGYKMEAESFNAKTHEHKAQIESITKLLEHEKARCKDLEMQITNLEELRAEERSRDIARIRELERALEAARRKAEELTERLNEPRYTEGPNVGTQADLADPQMVNECERLKNLLKRVSEGGYVDGFLSGVSGNRSGVCEFRLPVDWSSRPYAVEVEVSIDHSQWSAAGMLQLGDGSGKGCSPTDGDVPLDLLMIADRTGEEVAGHFIMSLSDRGLFTIRLQKNHHEWHLRVRLRYGSRVPQLERLLKAAGKDNSKLQADLASRRDLERALESARADCGVLAGERDSSREELREAKAALAAERDANERLEQGGAELEATAKSNIEAERRRGETLLREIDDPKRKQQGPYRAKSGSSGNDDGKYHGRGLKSVGASDDAEVKRLREEVEMLRRSSKSRPEHRHKAEVLSPTREGPAVASLPLAREGSSAPGDSTIYVLQSEIDRLRDELYSYESGWAPDLAALLADARHRATRAEMEVAELEAILKSRGISGLTPMLEGERRRADLAEAEVRRLKEEIRRSQEYGGGNYAMTRRADAAEEELRRLKREITRYQRSESPDLASALESEHRRAEKLEREVARMMDEIHRLRGTHSAAGGENPRAEYAEAELRQLREDFAVMMHREQLSAERTEGEIRRLQDELEAFEQGHKPDLARIIDQERERAARAEAEVRRLREEIRRHEVTHVSAEVGHGTSRSEVSGAEQADGEYSDIAPALDAERRRAERAEAEVLQLIEDLRAVQAGGSCPLGPILDDERHRAECAEVEVCRLQRELCELRNLNLSSGQPEGFDMVLHLQQHIQVLRNDLDKALRDRYEASRSLPV